MKGKIKAVIVVLLLLALTTGVMSTQHALFPSPSANSEISAKTSRIQLIARDIDEFAYNTTSPHTEYLLNNSSGTFLLKLGKWMGGANRSWLCAFGIVNVEPYPIYIMSASVSGDFANWLRIYAHANPNLPADNSTFRPGIVQEKDANFTLLWNGDGKGRQSTAHTYWKLSNATGYVDTYLGYDNNTSYDGGAWPYNNATWDGNNNLWIYNSTTQHLINDTAPYGIANFVWIEVVLIVPTGVDTKDYTCTIKFNLESET
ncbi:MAG: hypothetical protein ACP5LE_04765 [Thermoplasmata archaeon]